MSSEVVSNRVFSPIGGKVSVEVGHRGRRIQGLMRSLGNRGHVFGRLFIYFVGVLQTLVYLDRAVDVKLALRVLECRLAVNVYLQVIFVTGSVTDDLRSVDLLELENLRL